MYNEESEENTTFHQIREVVSTEKHIVTQGNSAEDDCRCEVCENAELFLIAVKSHFNKIGKKDLVVDIPTDPLELVSLGVCSVKDLPCIKGECEECPGQTVINVVCEELEKIESITFYKWVTKLKWLKKNLKEDEVILSVDFSKNYENK